MFNFLLTETEAPANAGSQWWIYVVLIVLVVAMLVLPSITNKRRMKEYNQMLDQLRTGDEVRTIGGIIGKVTKISNKGDVKTFTLETGSKGSKTTMEFDMAALGTVLKSTYVAPVEVEEKKQDKKTEKKEEVKAEEPVEVKTEEAPAVSVEEVVATEVAPVEVKEKKTPAKKTPAKKTTTKKAPAKKTTSK